MFRGGYEWSVGGAAVSPYEWMSLGRMGALAADHGHMFINLMGYGKGIDSKINCRSCKSVQSMRVSIRYIVIIKALISY
jgi:hypothetical protein